MKLSTETVLLNPQRFARNDSAGMPAAAMSRHSRAIVRVPPALLAVGVFITLAITSANASTITLPPPTYQANVIGSLEFFAGGVGSITTPGTQTDSANCFGVIGTCGVLNGLAGATGSFSATETMSALGPYVSVSATEDLFQGQLSGGGGSTWAKLTYSFEVLSIGGHGAVELDFAATGGISDVSGFISGVVSAGYPVAGTQAEATIDVYDNAENIYYNDQLSYNLGNTGEIDGVIDQGKSGSLNSSSSFLVPTNTVIEMEILALVNPGGTFPGTVTAYMDPIVSLDPSDGSGLTLVLSQGVTQGLGESATTGPTTTSGVPEPATYAMLGVGLLAMGGLRYRRGVWAASILNHASGDNRR
jgi:PEP-CTERM motif-containing protein